MLNLSKIKLCQCTGMWDSTIPGITLSNNFFLSFFQAQAIINEHLEHRRQERVEDPRK